MVLNSATNAPLRKALVALGRPNGGTRSYSAVTDAAGRFDFPTVDPGSYVCGIRFSRRLHLRHAETSKPSPPTPNHVAEDQRVSGIKVLLMPLGAISGRVTDDEGTPLSGLPFKRCPTLFIERRESD
jgi:protocatechuate 3,4-dioxygenase beta subunit